MTYPVVATSILRGVRAMSEPTFRQVAPDCDRCVKTGYLVCYIHKDENARRLEAAGGQVSKYVNIRVVGTEYDKGETK
jgi:hypothetical protein